MLTSRHGPENKADDLATNTKTSFPLSGVVRVSWLKRRHAHSQRTLPWRDILLILLYSFLLPFLLYLAIASVAPTVLGYLLMIIATVYALTAVAVLFEALRALPRKRARVSVDHDAPRHIHTNLPSVTALIVAYLPNEQDIILETLQYFLCHIRVPADRLQIILAYNTPHPLPLENHLQHLAAHDPRLLVLRVAGSSSKAENINATLAHVTGDMVGIFDADHHPDPLCFQKAWRWLQGGYDVVQGRCVIRNDRATWLTRLIGVEFSTMYAVAHTSRSLLADTAIFGGSNGYWRTALLRQLEMNPAMLTEDIDVSVRALLDGARILHDRSIIATELAPTTLTNWFYQRLRWAQGWYQVALKHSYPLLRSPRLNGWQKLYWAYILPWRECYGLLAPQALPLFLASLIKQVHDGGSWYWHPYLTATTILTLLSGTLSILVAYRHLVGLTQTPPPSTILAYLAVSPVFTLARNLIVLVSWLREARQQHEWITTARGRPVRTGSADGPGIESTGWSTGEDALGQPVAQPPGMFALPMVGGVTADPIRASGADD